MPEVAEAFHTLRAGNYRKIWPRCNTVGNLVELRLFVGQQAGIIRSELATDSCRIQSDSCIVYFLLPGGVVEKQQLTVRDGEKSWIELQFMAHEAEELLDMLTTYPSQRAEGDVGLLAPTGQDR